MCSACAWRVKKILELGAMAAGLLEPADNKKQWSIYEMWYMYGFVLATFNGLQESLKQTRQKRLGVEAANSAEKLRTCLLVNCEAVVAAR